MPVPTSLIRHPEPASIQPVPTSSVRHPSSRLGCRLDLIFSKGLYLKQPTSPSGKPAWSGRSVSDGMPRCDHDRRDIPVQQGKTKHYSPSRGMSEQVPGSGKGGGRVPLSCPLQDAQSHQAAPQEACRAARQKVCRPTSLCRPTCLCRAALQKLRRLVNLGPAGGVLVFSYPLGFYLIT